MSDIHDVETSVLLERQERLSVESYAHKEGVLPDREVSIIHCARKGCSNTRIAEDLYAGGWVALYAIKGMAAETPAELGGKAEFCSIQCAKQALADIEAAIDAATMEPT